MLSPFEFDVEALKIVAELVGLATVKQCITLKIIKMLAEAD